MVSTLSPFRDAVADAATVNRSLDGLRGLAARPTLLYGAGAYADEVADFLATPFEGNEGDPVAAAFWAGRAVALGKADASALYEQLRGKLNATQRAELDRKLSEEDPKPASSKSVP